MRGTRDVPVTSSRRALEQARELDEAPYVAAAQLLLALIDLEDGDGANADGARARGPRPLLTISRTTDRAPAASSYSRRQTLERSELEQAARLIGAAEGLRGGDPPDEFESPMLARSIPQLEARLGGDILTALIDEGRASGLAAIDPVVVSAEREA